MHHQHHVYITMGTPAHTLVYKGFITLQDLDSEGSEEEAPSDGPQQAASELEQPSRGAGAEEQNETNCTDQPTTTRIAPAVKQPRQLQVSGSCMPAEILVLVLEQLEWRDAVRAAQVCTHWHDVVVGR